MSLTVHVRVFVPGANTPEDSVGHYDMIVVGEHEFNGVTLTNPVFSYRASAKLQVFEESASSNYYKTAAGEYYHDCSIYKWTFVLPYDKYDTLVEELDGTIQTYSALGNSGKAFSCTLKDSNPFSTYVFEKYNCFHAVSVWLNTLGNFTLKAIYEAAHDYAYHDYSPENMAAKYAAKYWNRYYPEA